MTKRTREETLKMTDLVLEAIRNKPLYSKDLAEMFNLSKSDINNMLCRLKKQSLIEIYPQDLNKHYSYRRWVKTHRTETYFQVVKQNQKRAEILAISKSKGDITFSPLANPAMCKTSNDFHTHGNKNKINAWTGYTSMGNM